MKKEVASIKIGCLSVSVLRLFGRKVSSAMLKQLQIGDHTEDGANIWGYIIPDSERSCRYFLYEKAGTLYKSPFCGPTAIELMHLDRKAGHSAAQGRLSNGLKEELASARERFELDNMYSRNVPQLFIGI